MSTVVINVGGTGASQSASGGKIYAFAAISAVASQVAAANGNRRKIIFHNPGTVDILVAPVQILNASGLAVNLTPNNANRAGCFLVFANGGTLSIEGECQQAWQACSVGADTPLTVMDSNI